MRIPVLLSIFALSACAPEQRASLSVPVEAGGDAASFVTDDVEITLSEARIELSDLRLERPPEVSLRWRLAPIPVAWAHPGHDFSGDTSGELLGDWSVNLLGEPAYLGDALCYEGSYATGRVGLAGEPALVLAGVALTPSGARDFAFEVQLDDEISGIPFQHELSADSPPSGIGLSVKLAAMLGFVDWDTPDDDGDDILTTADGALGNSVPFGVMSTASYSLELWD
jgi:hypothetical protein